MHYIDQQPLDADYRQDMQLPFKTPGDVFIFMTNTPTLPPAGPQLSLNDPVIVQVKYSLLNDQTPLYIFPHNIFQPPKA
jgi:hypothetical protein